MKMSTRDRFLAAMRREEVDYVPCSIYFNYNLELPGYDLKNWREHVRLALDLGTAPVVHIGIPAKSHPDVSSRAWLESIGNTDVLYKEYQTPAGALRIGVRYTPDWPFGKEIPWDDFTAGHIIEPLIKDPDDVEPFSFLWQAPGEQELMARQDANQFAVALAREHNLPISGYAGNGLATLMFVMGAENMVMFAMDHPEAFKRLAQIDSQVNKARIRLNARVGADFVKRFGGYEQTNFLSPSLFREIVLPLLKEEAAVARATGIMIYYRVVTGMEPLLSDIASAGFDCIEGGEPRLSQCSFEMWHKAFAGKAASWTGISTPVLLGGKSETAVRQEVRQAIDVFGRRGFILGVTNSIRKHFPWANTLAMIDEWKKIRG